MGGQRLNRMATRRSFILGSVAVAGGVAIGVAVLGRRAAERLGGPTPPSFEPGQVAVTPYVVIDGDGIHIITPRAEMGQGIHTTLAALVAEELDVAFDEIRVIHGPASNVYGNDIFYGPRPLWQQLRHRPTQATGGQTSIRDGFVKMRQAGAAARHMLLAAASNQLGVPVASLQTDQGQVVAPDGQRLPYTDLAEAAARIAPPADPVLKSPSEWKLLGRSQPRVDMVAKCTGTAEYGIDVQLPNLHFATVRRNPHRGATLEDFDASAAESAPGVKAVVPLDDGVIVVASNTWYAMEAARGITFDWAAAAYPDSTAGHHDRIRATFDGAPYYRALGRGNVNQALQGEDVIEGEYVVPYLAHATLEPMNATAWLREGRLDIWAGNQFPTLAVHIGARLTGLSRDQVRVHTPYMGGGFGRRFEMDDVEAAVRAAMALPGTPVRVTYDRAEDLGQDTYRPAAVARFRARVKDGQAAALQLDVAAPSLIVSGRKRRRALDDDAPSHLPKRDSSIAMGAGDQPYRIPHYRVDAYRPEELLPVGWWRSVGESQNCFFHESIVDEMAAAAGRDPLEFRLSLLRHRPSREVLERVAERSGWGSPLPEGRARGLAYARASRQATAQVLEIERTDAGIRLRKAWAVVDVGIALDPRNIEAQVQGALLFGLSAAMFGEITVADGVVTQRNFDTYPLLRLHQAPEVDVDIIESGKEIYGVGEAGTSAAAPALGNALFALTGQRIRRLPFRNAVRFA